MSQEILSPITNNSATKKIKSLNIGQIVKSYVGLGIDVKPYFPKGYSEIEIRECVETGYQFYYPFGLDGDSEFYEHLQKFPWYYEPWKWEYEEAIKCLDKSQKILEIGSGGNKFVEKLNSEGYDITGLELNKDAVKSGINKGLKVLQETIQDHAKNNPNTYDAVVSFQVVEHITEVKSFMQSSIDALKEGGLLIVSVPNNNSFLQLREYSNLNLPPHHMGLWREKSLSKLENHFNIKLQEITFEPFSKFRRPNFYSYLHENKKPYLFYKIARNFWPSLIERKYSIEFLAFTIQAKFVKTKS